MPVSQAFVLMNLDLIAVPLQVGAAGVVTIYCGARRAGQLLGAGAESGSGLESVARRAGDTAAAHTFPCRSTIARNVAPLQSR